MTASEIIAELPNLSEAERREILRRILELERKEEKELKFVDDLFVAACRNIDEREKADARRFLHEAAVRTFQDIDNLEGRDDRKNR